MGKGEWALAWVIGGAVAVALIGTFGPSMVEATGGPPDNPLYHYQTLAAALLALASASIATYFLRRQIGQTQELEDERRRGRREAARTWLSLHLSAILGYAEATGKGIWTLIRRCDGEVLPHQPQLPAFPPLPMEAAVAVKEFAEFADANEARFLALMFGTMQVLNARVSSVVERPAGTSLANLEEYLDDAAELYARAEALLGYARHKEPGFPAGVTWERQRAALFFMTHRHEPTERLARRIAEGSGGDMQSFIPNMFEGD